MTFWGRPDFWCNCIPIWYAYSYHTLMYTIHDRGQTLSSNAWHNRHEIWIDLSYLFYWNEYFLHCSLVHSGHSLSLSLLLWVPCSKHALLSLGLISFAADGRWSATVNRQNCPWDQCYCWTPYCLTSSGWKEAVLVKGKHLSFKWTQEEKLLPKEKELLLLLMFFVIQNVNLQLYWNN